MADAYAFRGASQQRLASLLNPNLTNPYIDGLQSGGVTMAQTSPSWCSWVALVLLGMLVGFFLALLLYYFF